MLLKIMGDDNTGDTDRRKTFQLFDHVESAKFERAKKGGAATVAVLFEGGDQETFEVSGNAYLMNAQGDTVASFGAHPVV